MSEAFITIPISFSHPAFLALSLSLTDNTHTLSLSFPLKDLFKRRLSLSSSVDTSIVAAQSPSSLCLASNPNLGSQTLLELMSVNQGTVKTSDDLAILVTHLQCTCKRISTAITSPFGSKIGMKIEARSVKESGRDAPKPLDLISNDIILSSLRSSGKVIVMASEEDEEQVWITDCGPFIIVTDPLDGSRNIDASILTGTIFRIYNKLAELDHLPVQKKAQLNSL